MTDLRPRPPRTSTRAWVPVAATMFAIGWGANQFVSVLVAYREHSGLSVGTVDALVGAYAVGLIPALLVLGPASDRSGRAPVLRIAAIVSLAATAVLMVGSLWALYAGRLLAGVASGAAFAAGSAWVEELSAAPWDPASLPGAGARPAAMSPTAGFALGPVVAGLHAQWAPDPLVTAYVPHVLVVLAVILPLSRATATAPPARRARARGARAPRGVRAVGGGAGAAPGRRAGAGVPPVGAAGAVGGRPGVPAVGGAGRAVGVRLGPRVDRGAPRVGDRHDRG